MKKSILKKERKNARKTGLSLDTCLSNICVVDVMWALEPEYIPVFMRTWYAVIGGTELLGLFSTRAEAYSYRLHFINRLLNN